MFNRLPLSDRRVRSTELHRLDIAAPEEAEKKPSVDLHSLCVLNDCQPRYASPYVAPPTKARPPSWQYLCPRSTARWWSHHLVRAVL